MFVNAVPQIFLKKISLRSGPSPKKNLKIEIKGHILLKQNPELDWDMQS